MRECDGHVTVRVKVNGSQLEKKVVTVNLSTSDMSAFGENSTKLVMHCVINIVLPVKYLTFQQLMSTTKG